MKRGEGHSTNQKGNITMMKKIDALKIALATMTDAEAIETVKHMIAQLSAPRPMSEEKKAARREKTAAARHELMAKVIPAITAVLPTSAEEGRTAKEIFEAAKANLPSDFTANKVQYVLLNDIADIVGKTEAKGKANTYYRIAK